MSRLSRASRMSRTEMQSTNKKRAVGTRPFGRELWIICQLRYEIAVSTR
jgi:hypothetical protein